MSRRAVSLVIAVVASTLLIAGPLSAGAVDTGNTFTERAQIAFDAAGDVYMAAFDDGADELVVARFDSGGDLDTSFGIGGLVATPRSTILGSIDGVGRVDVTAGNDMVYVHTQGVVYAYDDTGMLLWESATARCDFVGLPTISLSPDESILWTGALDDGGCTNGTIGQMDALTGEGLKQGDLAPYAFTTVAKDNDHVWVVDIRSAALASFGDQIGMGGQPWGVSHEVNIDADVAYPVVLDYASTFSAQPPAFLDGSGYLTVAGPVESGGVTTNVALMRLSEAGLDATFGTGGIVDIPSTKLAVGLGYTTDGTTMLALSDDTTGTIFAFDPSGSTDNDFGTSGLMDIAHPIGEAAVQDDVLAIGWADGSTLNVELIDLGPVNTFTDDDNSVFEEDIEWLAAAGITSGCNPPVFDQFCPGDNVTRGQMAAFLVRALDLTDDGGGNTFTDDDNSVFEEDIAKLAAAGITAGCNPPTFDNFCPGDFVTRGQMAAFLVRALDLTDDGGGNTFTDDDNSVFEEDIAKLAAAGITAGCNPPTFDNFCPADNVTRGQMAAFLRRALEE